jgi:hypothetical protein
MATGSIKISNLPDLTPVPFNTDLVGVDCNTSITHKVSLSEVRNTLKQTFVQNAQTASMLQPYVLTAQTASMLQPYVLNAQTASMLQPYVLTANTASMLQPYVLTANTASMLQPYVLTAQTASMLQPYVLNSQTESFATTGSNTFIGNQIIVGNVTFPSGSFISTTDESGSLSFSALNGGTLYLNSDGGEGDVLVGYDGWDGKLKVRGEIEITGSLEQGSGVIASGSYSHAEGNITQAIGDYSHAEGDNTQAIGEYSHAEGQEAISVGNYSHAEGYDTRAIGDRSHAEGTGTKTGTQNAYYAESVVSGVVTLSGSYGDVSGQFGADNRLYLYDQPFDDNYDRETFIISQSYYSGSTNTIVELYNTSVNTSIAYVGDLGQGIANWAGNQTIPGNYSHTEGSNTQAIGQYSHADGVSTQAIGNYSHAEGEAVQAIGGASHAEGYQTQAIGQYSHAEGNQTIAAGNFSHAEGQSTQAIGGYSHAEGNSTQARGLGSHAEGVDTIALGNYSHAEGLGTIASGSYQLAIGGYNAHGDDKSTFILGGGGTLASRRTAARFVQFDSSAEKGPSNSATTGSWVLTQVSESLNFANDTAAGTAGVPLGGLYHDNGIIRIRLV